MKKMLLFTAISFLIGIGYAQVSTFPWTEDFESGTFPPDGWIKVSVAASADWEKTESKTYNSSEGAALCASATDFGTSEAWLITPQLSIPSEGDYVFEFWSYLGLPSSYEYSGVWVSTTDNSTASFVELKKLEKNTSDILSPAGWAKINVSLNDYKGQDIYIGFKNRATRYGHDWYIDDVSIIDMSSYVDAELVQIITPSAGAQFDLTANETVKVLIKNNGGSAISNFNLNLQCGSVDVNETYTGTIPAGDQDEYTFDQKLDLSAADEYTITTTISGVASDQVADNNSKNITLTNTVCKSASLSEGFEGTTFPPACWKSTQVLGSKNWERSTAQAHEGSASAYQNYGSYSEDLETWLITPPITINSTNYTLEFYSYISSSLDCSEVWISTVNNNPSSFTGSPVKTFESSDIKDSWVKVSIPLAGYNGETIYIGFKYGGKFAHKWYIDDVNVRDMSSYIDAELAQIITPGAGTQINLSAEEEVKVLIKNNGGSALSGFDLKLKCSEVDITETYSGSIAAFDTASYTFTQKLDLSADGKDTITVTVIASGDQNAGNDSKTVMLNNVVCSTSLPYTEGFEGNGAAFSPCWTQERITGTTDWKVAQTVASVTPNTVHGGSYKAYMYGTTKGNTTKLISPPFDLSTLEEPALTFWHTQQDWGTQDILKIYYKDSKDAAWTHLRSFENNIEDWVEDTILLPNKSSEYYIAFEGIVNYGHGIQLDDISILETAPFDGNVDAELVRIETPTQGQKPSFTASEDVKVLVRNNGNMPLSTFSLQLECGVIDTTEDYNGAAIATGDSAYYTFTKKLDLSAEGSHTITVTVIAEDDEVPANDSKEIIINQPISAFPYVEDFESETFPPVDWTKTGNTAEWVRTTSNTYNGSEGSAFYDLSNMSGSNVEGWLITPLLSIPAAASEDFVVEFQSRLAIYGSYISEQSGVWVSVTDNNPSSFVELKRLQENTQDVPKPVSWTKITVSLNDYKGQNIYIGFKNIAANKNMGREWRIDNVKVQEFQHFVDAQVAQIITPKVGTYSNLTANEEVKVKIKNKGSRYLESFNLELSVNGTSVSEAYNGEAIPSGDSVEYVLTNKLNLSAQGDYTITVKAIAASDIDLKNDSISITLSNIICTAVNTFPYIEDFESEIFPPSSPNCWERFKYSAAAGEWRRSTEIAHNNGSACFIPSNGMPEVWLVSPQIEVPSTGNYQLSFWSYVEYPSLLQQSIVLVSTDGNDPKVSSFTEIKRLSQNTADVPRPAAWKKIIIPLNDYAGQTINVGFKYFSTSVAAHDWYIDDVSVYDLDSYVDVEIVAIRHPLRGTNIDLTETEQVEITLRNNGGNDISNITLKLEVDGILEASETYTGTIAAGDSALYKFNKKINLLMPDTYNIKVTAVLAGDQDDFNDSKSIDAVVVSTAVFAPWLENFEGFDFPPANWTNHQIQGAEAGWTKDIATHEIHGGMFSALYNMNVEPHEGWLVTPKVIVPETGNYVLEFWSYIKLPVVYGYSGVWISTEGSNPTEAKFIEIKKLSGEEISEKWTKIIIPLNDYLGEKIYIGFKYKSDNTQGHAWNIDNVKVYDFSGVVDAELARIITPVSGTSHELTNAEQVKVRIKNGGSEPLSGFDLQLKVNNTVIATENYSGEAIPSLSAMEYTFGTTLDLSVLGDYKITVRIIVAGDQDASNDSITIMVSKDNCLPITEFPFTEGFETLGSAPDCWTAFPNDGVNLEFDDEEFHSGVGAAHFAPGFEMVDRWLVTPKLSIPDEENYVLEFWSFIGGLYYEYSGVWVSTSGNNPAGSTFVELKEIGGTSMFSWDKISIPLKNYAGQDIYIGFKYVGVAAHRWHIDDVNVFKGDDAANAPVVSSEKLSVYPNPVKDVLHIQSEQPIKQIIVLDVQGKIVLQLQGDNRKVNMQALPQGSYLVRVRTERGTSSIKVMKQK